MHDLDPLLKPRSVAVVGASRTARTIGHEVVANLVRAGFSGPVYPVNPKADSIRSMRAFPSLSAIPWPVDLVVLAVPRDLVLPAVKDAAAKGVKALVTITAGFKEVGGEGIAREQAIVDVLRANGMRMVGPNCMGVINTDPAVSLNASFAARTPPAGSVAFASQSGALGEAILDTAADLGLGLSSFVSLGNKADVSSNDLLDWWAADPRTKLVLLYLESFGNPRRFAQLARRLTRTHGKPILAVKSGRSRRGAEAASSHTGALAGTDAAVSSLLRQCGVIRANTVHELFTLAQGFASQPLPTGRRLAVLTNAGGPGILATDAAAHVGLELAELLPATQAAMAKVLPPEASLRNPVDMIASASPEQFAACSAALLADPGVDALLPIFVSPATMDAERVATALAAGIEDGRARGGAGKPVLACFMGRNKGDEGRAILRGAGIPVYDFPESATSALAAMAWFAEFRAEPTGSAPKLNVDTARAAAALKGKEGWLRWPDAMEVMEAYGIPVAPWAMVSDPDAARAFADTHGYPIVVKLDSDTILHRSDAGGVAVDLRSEREIQGAFWELERNVAGTPGDHRLIAQTMVQGGTECLIGATTDPVVGHILAFGLGGVFVELMRDVVFRLHPLTDRDAESMVRSIKAFPLLDGARGRKPVDRKQLEDVLLRVSALLSDFPQIAELDLNPFFAHPETGRAAAADVRLRVAPSR